MTFKYKLAGPDGLEITIDNEKASGHPTFRNFESLAFLTLGPIKHSELIAQIKRGGILLSLLQQIGTRIKIIPNDNISSDEDCVVSYGEDDEISWNPAHND